ncbi:hypothetical protein [Mammaliicoccus sciuri]|uniref:hypothetical protein n=1 Tax=Mammaliicoccus sciuri TaxID=1296 RepID=UPI00265C3788|nr:hypothetical protein [Mammaliicoccus sciuri]MDO0950115.1 hypothetical protein [Mammaliicoccus sciuri]MDO0954660.1 hypothetical protein [Mammaliicoccus sciuri]
MSGDELLIQRFSYQYAIFSTSGFSENAIKLAIAYKITLIDLSGNEYKDLLETINIVAMRLFEVLEINEIKLDKIRQYIRIILFDKRASYDEQLINRLYIDYILEPLFNKIDEYGDLYMASVNSPFSILLKPSSPEGFRKFVSDYRESTIVVSIIWGNDERNFWEIYIQNNGRRELVFTFYLPELIENYIFNRQNNTDIFANALNAKEQFFESMVFYMRSAEKFITFKYNAPNVLNK